MVVTSKVLGLALLSALSLAAPFEETSSGLQARDADAAADAIADALLEERDVLLDERDLFDADLEARDFEHNWIGARDVNDFDSLIEVLSRPARVTFVC